MSYSPEFLSLANKLHVVLASMDACNSKRDRATVVKQLFTNILENKALIVATIKLLRDIELRRSQLYKLIISIYKKSIDVHNEMIKFDVGDAQSLQLCRKVERFARLTIVNLFNHKPEKYETFLESPYVRRSPRLNKVDAVPLRRSARLANK